jgi:cytochrome c biogenesis protein CcdA
MSERRTRTIPQWILLLGVYALGLAIWTLYIAAFLYLFFRFFT